MKHRIVHLLQKYFLNPPIKFLLAVKTSRHSCFRKMSPGSANGGLPLNCRAAPRMPVSCAYLGRNCLRCGLIWMGDSRVDSAKPNRKGFGMGNSDREQSWLSVRNFV